MVAEVERRSVFRANFFEKNVSILKFIGEENREMRSILSFCGCLVLLAALCLSVYGARKEMPKANYDESLVGELTLPDPLTASDGTRITTAEEWNAKRRPELLKLFESDMYGYMPPKECANLAFETLSDETVFDGKAIRREIRIYFNAPEKLPKMDLLLYIPAKASKPVPAFLSPNFPGNHTVCDDPGVRLPDLEGGTRVKQPVDESTRGGNKSRWALDKILDRGYALATVYYEEIDPDFDDGRQNGVHPLFARWEEENAIPPESRAATITAWAWGLSRALDYLETVPEINAKKVALMGHSRLGKTALWGAACDERFAMAISNDSGCGGASLTRRNFGETIAIMDAALWWWFCEKYLTYVADPNLLPFDQHELIALIAPRPVYIASAVEDTWADPKGEFLAAYYADPVYRLLGTDGIAGVTEWPPVDTPVGGTIHYHMRTGKHDVVDYDWEQYLDFADKYLK